MGTVEEAGLASDEETDVVDETDPTVAEEVGSRGEGSGVELLWLTFVDSHQPLPTSRQSANARTLHNTALFCLLCGDGTKTGRSAASSSAFTCSVHSVPFQKRSWESSCGSGYQPGSDMVIIL